MKPIDLRWELHSWASDSPRRYGTRFGHAPSQAWFRRPIRPAQLHSQPTRWWGLGLQASRTRAWSPCGHCISTSASSTWNPFSHIFRAGLDGRASQQPPPRGWNLGTSWLSFTRSVCMNVYIYIYIYSYVFFIYMPCCDILDITLF